MEAGSSQGVQHAVGGESSDEDEDLEQIPLDISQDERRLVTQPYDLSVSSLIEDISDERLLLELKGKLGAELPLAGAAAAVGDAASDIQQALMALGYSEKDAAAALKALPAGVGVSEGIKAALKSLAK